MESEIMTTKEVAAYMKISKNAASTLVAKLPHFGVKGRRIHRHTIDTYVQTGGNLEQTKRILLRHLEGGGK